MVLMAVLLSIKPKYVHEILNENKKYEFRKSIFKRYDVSTAYIYSTNPIKKLIGKFTIGEIIEDHPQVLWQNLSNFAGLEQDEFFKYFQDRETGFAIEIKDLEVFESPIEPKDLIPNFVPPQSFYYIDEDIFKMHLNPKNGQGEQLGQCRFNSK